MSDKLELIKKLAAAKKMVASTKVKKAGYNDYSNYHYFTPEQVSAIVADACEKNGLVTVFDLIRDEYGITGHLHIIDVDGGGTITIRMATDIPSIKATNVAQQLGGAATYTERYLKMTAFGITEDSLDFDNSARTKERVKAELPKPIAPAKPMTKNIILKSMDKKTLAYFEENLGKVAYDKIVAALGKYDTTTGYGKQAAETVTAYAKNLK